MDLSFYRIWLIALLMLSKTASGQSCFSCGDGSMGDFTAVNDTIIPGGNYQFTSFVIEKGVTVKIVGNSPFILKCTGLVNLQGTLSANGENGGDGKNNSGAGLGGLGYGGGANGGDGSFSATTSLKGFNGSGTGHGSFGSNSGGGGGAGFAFPGLSSSGIGGLSYGNNTLTPLQAGSGGGGGSCGINNGAGGGGAGGGIIAIYSCDKINISETGAIICNGGNGGNDNSGNCGAGGGGSGGTIWLAARVVNNTGLISALGGKGGQSNLNSILGNGGDGSDGRIRIDYHYSSLTGLIFPPSGFSDTPFIAHIFRSLDAKCFGSPSGYAKVRSNGGKYPTKFLWSNGSSLAEVKNIPAGNYVVTVTDANGCTQKQTVTINEPSAIKPIATIETPSCSGGNDGFIYTSATGGLPYPATRNLTTSTRFSNDSSCGIMIDLSVGKPININSFSLSFNTADTVHLQFWYKLGSYHNFENDPTAWTSLGTFAVKSDGIHENTKIILPTPVLLGEGTYSFYMVNNDGEIDCIGSKALGSKFIFDHVLTLYQGLGRGRNSSPFSATIKPMQYFTGVINYTIPSINGLSYEYLWGKTIPGNEINKLSAGAYQVSITDAIGCSQNSTITLPEPESIAVNTLTKNPPSCPHGTNGEIEIIANGGNLKRTLTNSYNCDEQTSGIMFSLNINSPVDLDFLNILLTETSQVSVWIKKGPFAGFEQTPGAWTNSGSKLLQPISPEVPIQFQLNRIPLSTGKWSIYVYSYGGKIKTISNHNPVTTLVSSTFVDLLKGENILPNGTPFNSISGGLMFFGGSVGYSIPAGGYTYQWNDGSHNTSIINLKSDVYTLSVTDVGGCIQQTNIYLDEPLPIKLNVVSTNAIDSFANGSASISATGGTSPYYYFWPTTQQSGPLILNVPTGKYPVLIVDDHGCIAYDSVNIARTLSPVPETGILVLLPNPGNNFIKIGKEIPGMEACNMRLFNSVGQLIFNNQTSIFSLMTEGLNLDKLSDGNYLLSVSDDDQIYTTKLMVIR